MDPFQNLLAQYFEDKIRDAAGDENAYREALEEKAAAVRSGNSPDSVHLLEAEKQLRALDSRSKAISQAIDDGQLSYATAYDIINDLNRLNFQMYPGRGAGRLAHAAELIQGVHVQDARLQRELQRFRSGLKLLGLQFSLHAEVGRLVRSERSLMDMLFSEDEILGKAMYAAEQMQVLLDSLQPLLAQLDRMRLQAGEEYKALEKQRFELIAQARIFPSAD